MPSLRLQAQHLWCGVFGCLLPAFLRKEGFWRLRVTQRDPECTQPTGCQLKLKSICRSQRPFCLLNVACHGKQGQCECQLLMGRITSLSCGIKFEVQSLSCASRIHSKRRERKKAEGGKTAILQAQHYSICFTLLFHLVQIFFLFYYQIMTLARYPSYFIDWGGFKIAG